MRYFAKFDDEGNRLESIVEGVHFEIIPSKPIIEYEKGEEIYTIEPAHDIVDEDGNVTHIDEVKTATGEYEQIEKIVGCTKEKIEPQISSDFVEITEEEQTLYQTNEYIRGKDGKPQKKVPQPPTIADKTNLIKQKYEQQITELKDALATATLANDTTSIEELKKEYTELMKKYEAELEALNNAKTV